MLGIISRRTTKQRRTIVTRVERIERLYQQLGKQGVFSATTRGRWFSDLFLTPLYTTVPEKDRERTGFVGLGIDTGYRYDWLFASLSFGVFQSGQRRLSATVDEALTRYQPGLQAGAELKIVRNLDVFFGPGLTLSADDVETTSVAASGALENVESSRTRVHPLLVIGAVAGNFFARDVFTIAGTPEIQLDLGVAFGQRSSESGSRA